MGCTYSYCFVGNITPTTWCRLEVPIVLHDPIPSLELLLELLTVYFAFLSSCKGQSSYGVLPFLDLYNLCTRVGDLIIL